MTASDSDEDSSLETHPVREGLFTRYESLLDARDVDLLSTAYALAAADLLRDGRIVDSGALEKAVLLEGMGRKMGASEIAEIVAKRFRAPS